jgi:alpha-mannosidase
MIKVHLIFNAHLDPIWLWSWRDGLDEVLNTSYYICNLLDRHPDIIYTRGEAWVYEQVKRIDPALFERIRAHIKAGRWSTVGGWYIQPDCNAPSGFAMARQISLGQKMFHDYFGTAPRIGYNVDSFGHAATLPEYMRQAGQTGYVMMRPQEHELKLPARVFRWRGYADGPEIPTFRIADAYCTPAGLTEKHIQASISELPEGVSHTMCFIGVGDHGGGPTEEMIEWCRANQKSIPGVELVFSSPEKFFEAIAPDLEKLPLVTGELQMHAVGCYTVHRPVKMLLRKAEHKMIQAETSLQKWGATEFAGELLTAWKQVCFHQFHDTLGGTCLPSAYEDIHAQLGRALAIADEISSVCLRQHLVSLPVDTAQRMVFFNASDLPFEDFVEIEPWLEWSAWQPTWQLHDGQGQSVPYQVIAAESQADPISRLLLPMSLAAGELKVLRIVDAKIVEPDVQSDLTASGSKISVANGPSFDVENGGSLVLPPLGNLTLPELALYDDPTDTWSHGIDRFARENRQAAAWQTPQVIDNGPLMASLIQTGTIGSSQVQAEWRIHQGQRWIECHLRVNWMERRRVLKLEINLPSDIAEREDGILGGSITRAPDGRELPLRDWTRLNTKTEAGSGIQMAIVAPEIYALAGDARCVGLTLLRSPLMAWHDPNPGVHPRGIYSDRGEHFFRFRFMAAPTISVAALDQMAFGLQRPPLTADFTRGMKNRALRKEYAPPAAS